VTVGVGGTAVAEPEGTTDGDGPVEPSRLADVDGVDEAMAAVPPSGRRTRNATRIAAATATMTSPTAPARAPVRPASRC
jgi:hypothetical protein